MYEIDFNHLVPDSGCQHLVNGHFASIGTLCVLTRLKALLAQ